MELWGFIDAVSVVTLSDAESRTLDMRFFALRATAGTGEALTIFKHISTRQAVCGRNGYVFILRGDRARDVRQMIGNFFFRYPHFPGNLPGTHLFFTQQGYDLLPNSGHGFSSRPRTRARRRPRHHTEQPFHGPQFQVQIA